VITVEGAFATSHAFAFMPPTRWDAFRARLRAMYRERYGQLPAEPEAVASESDADVECRYATLAAAHDEVRRRIRALKPDAIVLIGNDQNENFTELGIPQFAIYTGARAIASDWLSDTQREYPCDAELAKAMLAGAVASGFDVVQTTRFRDDTLLAHAHTQVMVRLFPEADVPVVPVFVNAITPPLAAPGRCFAFGRALAAALATGTLSRRVVIGVSGGLSHFTFGYPYGLLKQPRSIGTICTEFDRGLLDRIRGGELEALAGMSDEELLANGDVEFRQSLAFFGMFAPGTRPDFLTYDPIYRAMTGLWVGYWSRPALASDDAAPPRAAS
jgi:hypothetical protein